VTGAVPVKVSVTVLLVVRVVVLVRERVKFSLVVALLKALDLVTLVRVILPGTVVMVLAVVVPEMRAGRGALIKMAVTVWTPIPLGLPQRALAIRDITPGAVAVPITLLAVALVALVAAVTVVPTTFATRRPTRAAAVVELLMALVALAVRELLF